jgi:hypothetical protein
MKKTVYRRCHPIRLHATEETHLANRGTVLEESMQYGEARDLEVHSLKEE